MSIHGSLINGIAQSYWSKMQQRQVEEEQRLRIYLAKWNVVIGPYTDRSPYTGRIQCVYCRSVHRQSYDTCKNCGAPRE